MLINKCTDCNHRDICKHEDEYDKVISELNVKVPEPFTLVLNCKHYYSTQSYLRSSNQDSYSNWSNCSEASNTLKPYPPGGHEIVY
jgi:hypothetical protein